MHHGQVLPGIQDLAAKGVQVEGGLTGEELVGVRAVLGVLDKAGDVEPLEAEEALLGLVRGPGVHVTRPPVGGLLAVERGPCTGEGPKQLCGCRHAIQSAPPVLHVPAAQR